MRNTATSLRLPNHKPLSLIGFVLLAETRRPRVDVGVQQSQLGWRAALARQPPLPLLASPSFSAAGWSRCTRPISASRSATAASGRGPSARIRLIHILAARIAATSEFTAASVGAGS
jgi:hypothetical protein